MSDDGQKDDVITLESQDIEIQELPEFPDREEFVKTQEMDGPPHLEQTRPGRDPLSTRPMQPVLEKTTQRYDVPDSLLEEARRTYRGEEEVWLEFEAEPDENGTIKLPPHIRRAVKKSRVLIRLRPTEPPDK